MTTCELVKRASRAGPDRVRHPVLQRTVRAGAVVGAGVRDEGAGDGARVAAVGVERGLRAGVRPLVRARLRVNVLVRALQQA